MEKIDNNENIIENKTSNELQELKNTIINDKEYFIDRLEDGVNLNIDRQDKDFFLGYIGSNNIYLSIDGKQYGEYKWDKEKNLYILQNHKDGNISLRIKQGKKYTITLKEKVIDNNYQLYISKNLKREDIKKLYEIFTEKEDQIETKIPKVLDYLENIIKKHNLSINNGEYIYYVDKILQRGFLINNNAGKLEVIGYQKVSTGNPNRKKKRHFETPDLIIDRTKSNSNGKKDLYKGDWKSIGTDRKGYGEKGSKIFNLGEYFIDEKGDAYIVQEKDENGKGYIINKEGEKISAYVNFHFAMHKTTPWATTQLGRKMSQGCIRNSPFTIDLLDKQDLFNGKKGKYIIIGSYKTK